MVCTIGDQELDSLKVALRGSNTESCTTIIIIGIDSPSLILKNCHVLHVVLESGIKETIVIIIKVLDLDRSVWLYLSSFTLL
jgi:hypothetical protein